MKVAEIHPFGAIRYEKAGVQVVSVRGEVDLASAHRLNALIAEAMAQPREVNTCVVVDLSGVEFIDTTGLEVLLQDWKAFREYSGDLHLAVSEGPVKRLLEISALDETLDGYVYENLDAAIEERVLVPS
jgi:anti-sigma B factor antagonist